MRYILATIILATLSYASCICVEPSEPYCVDSSYTYESQSRFNSCKSDIEYYTQQWASFIKCNADCAQNEIQSTINKFNCKASGKSYCY